MCGGTSVNMPATPAAPTTAESINAYIAGMPQMYQAQLDWQPKLTEQAMNMYQQYMPEATAVSQALQTQYAPQQAEQQWQLQQQYAPLLAAQQQQLQQQYQPESYAALQTLGGNMNADWMNNAPLNVATDPTLQGMQGMATPEWMQGYKAQEAPGMQAARDRLTQSARSAWASRGLAESGMSAEDETKMLSEFELPYALQQEQLTQDVNAQRQQLGYNLGTAGLQSQQAALAAQAQELGRRQDVGLQMAGKYQSPTTPTVSTPQVGQSNFAIPDVMSGYSFPQVQNSTMQGYGNYSSALSSMYGTANQSKPLSLGFLGNWGV